MNATMNAPTTISRQSTSEDRQIALKQMYAQVLERQPYAYECKELAKAEKDFLSGKLGIRHFLHTLACSKVYLDSFYYNCSNFKFVESCFKHFLGRAIVDGAEMKVYMDILLKQGYEKMFAEIFGSEEYRKAFGCFTIPHVRDRQFYPSTQNFLQSDIVNHEHTGQHGMVLPALYWKPLGLVCDGGTCRLPLEDALIVLQKIYAQVLERQPYAAERKQLAAIETDFTAGKLSVRDFIYQLACSQVYLDSFFFNHANLKFIERCCKHFLGRAPLGHEELHAYTEFLTRHGVEQLIRAMLFSGEYLQAFGSSQVPHARTLTAYPSMRNYQQSQLLNQELVERRGSVLPTLYWQQLNLHVDGKPAAQTVPPIAPPSATTTSATTMPAAKNMDEEIEELLRMLQGRDPKQVLQSLSTRQKTLLRDLARR